MLTSEELRVAYRLRLKRTRHPSCFRSNRYLVAWKPGSTPPPYPQKTSRDATFSIWTSTVTPPLPSDAPWLKEPVNLPWDHPGVTAVVEAAAAVLGERPSVELSPFVCDANFWFPQGQPCLVFGLGDTSWGIHGTNEKLPVEDLIKGVKAFAAVTMEWCGIA